MVTIAPTTVAVTRLKSKLSTKSASNAHIHLSVKIPLPNVSRDILRYSLALLIKLLSRTNRLLF